VRKNLWESIFCRLKVHDQGQVGVLVTFSAELFSAYLSCGMSGTDSKIKSIPLLVESSLPGVEVILLRNFSGKKSYKNQLKIPIGLEEPILTDEGLPCVIVPSSTNIRWTNLRLDEITFFK
jgi:hypothetical protein